ncbi:hypothetical protein H2O14_08860 [Rhizobium sp. G21]|nr:hypothetical protein [Rhizobium sp. G21]
MPMEGDFPKDDGPLYVLGRGPSVGSARAAALWFHEIAHMSATPMTGGIFRHGPIEAVGRAFQVIGFAPKDIDLTANLALAEDIRGAGGAVRLIGPDRDWAYPEISPLLAPLVEIVPAQRAALAAALARGAPLGETRFR